MTYFVHFFLTIPGILAKIPKGDVYEKLRFEETLGLGQISHCFLRLYIDLILLSDFRAF